MSIAYCKNWFRAQKRPTKLWTVEEARKAYDAREWHTAMICGQVKPQALVESNGKFVGVEFLDDLLRSHLVYVFAEVEPGRLFMERATVRKYDGDTDKITSGTTYYFKPDGGLVVAEQDILTGKQVRKVAQAPVDVSANWEPYPKFGEYDSLIRKERGLKKNG